MTDHDLATLARANPVPPGDVAGTARSAWGRATVDRIAAGPVLSPKPRRWLPIAAGAAGLAALVAVFVALVVATGGGSAPTAAETVVTAPGLPAAGLDDVAATIRRRAELLGAASVTVERPGDRIVVTQPEDSDPLPLGRGRLTARGIPPERPAAPGSGPVAPTPITQIGVRAARASEPEHVMVELTAAGAARFRALTRGLVQEAALRNVPDAVFAVVLDGAEITRATVSAADYPHGIEGGNGVDLLLTAGSSPRVVAALVNTPLPDLDVRPERGWTSYTPAP